MGGGCYHTRSFSRGVDDVSQGKLSEEGRGVCGMKGGCYGADWYEKKKGEGWKE